MAVITNTFTTAGAKLNRESLSNVVSNITPRDTPLLSLMGRETAMATFETWGIDTIRAPAANAQLEGDTYTFNALAAPTKVGNHQQIMRESWVLSGSQEAVANAGNVEKIREAKIKAGVAIKKDTELAIVSNTASVAGATRVMGGLPSWLTTNVSRGSGGSNGGYNTGTTLTVAATDGTQRAFTKTLLDATMQACHSNGANVKFAVMSPYVKSVFTTFMSDANVASFRYAAKEGKNTLIGDVSTYLGPHGEIDVITNRVMGASAAVARNVFLVDDEMLSMSVLRPIAEDKKVISNADAMAGVIIGEHTLKVKNEAGLGVVADVYGLTVSS